jgi:hypothetical protein
LIKTTSRMPAHAFPQHLFIVAFSLAAACANASPCDRMKVALSPAQSSSFSSSIARQMNAPSAKIVHSYHLGNWYLFNVNTPIASDNLTLYRGDPATHRYIAEWNGTGGRTSQTELRTWARSNAPGIPEALAKCFAFIGAAQR